MHVKAAAAAGLWQDRRAMRARGTGWAVLAVGLLSSSGCYTLEPFACNQTEQCVSANGLGICAEPGYCAFEDDACPSGYRFDDLASRGLAGECVEPQAEVTSSSSSGDVELGTSSSSTSGTSSSSSEGDDTTGSINLCGDRPCPCAVDIAAGSEHTCAIRTDCSVACWVND